MILNPNMNLLLKNKKGFSPEMYIVHSPTGLTKAHLDKEISKAAEIDQNKNEMKKKECASCPSPSVSSLARFESVKFVLITRL